MSNAPTGKFPVNASSIVFSNDSFIFRTDRDPLFGVAPSRLNLPNFVITYGTVTKPEREPLSGLNVTFLQIGNVTAGQSSDGLLCVRGAIRKDCSQTRSSVMKSLIVSVPWEGNYSVELFGDAISGFLESQEGVSLFSVTSAHSFVADAHFVPFAATPSLAATPTSTEPFTFSLQSRFLCRKAFLLHFGWFMWAIWDF
jgi:hypothetical protein